MIITGVVIKEKEMATHYNIVNSTVYDTVLTQKMIHGVQPSLYQSYEWVTIYIGIR